MAFVPSVMGRGLGRGHKVDIGESVGTRRRTIHR